MMGVFFFNAKQILKSMQIRVFKNFMGKCVYEKYCKHFKNFCIKSSSSFHFIFHKLLEGCSNAFQNIQVSWACWLLFLRNIYIYICSEVKLAQISHSLPLKALAHLPTWFSSPAERQALLIPPETETPCDTSNFIPPAFWPVYPGWSWSILPSLYLSVPTMSGEQAVTYCLQSRKQMENKDNEGAPGAKLQTGKEG